VPESTPGFDPVREALDALPDGAVVADGDGLVTTVNRAAARLLRVRPEDALGRPLGDVLALQDTEGRDWYSVNRPYDGLATRSAVPEQSWLLTDGTEVLVMARIRRPALDGPVDLVAVSLRSGRGRARLDRERSDLVATVAHELRSPLTGVKGFVQALLNRWDKLNDEQKKLMLTTVYADSERLSRLIAELLDVARIDTGRLALYPRPSDVRVLVGRVVESVRASTSRTIDLEVAETAGAAGGLPEVHADPDKLTQVVTNLIENAVRHGEGRVLVTLAALGEDADFPGVSITVDDEGTGIAPEIRKRVFTKFWKHGERGGSGLGMYLVNGLIRAHGGTLLIDDAPGGGARIVIAWPAPDPERH
jgi:signal transduction histidine kinase